MAVVAVGTAYSVPYSVAKLPQKRWKKEKEGCKGAVTCQERETGGLRDKVVNT